MKVAVLLLAALVLAGCQGLLGQQSITMPELIDLMKAHNGSGCFYGVGAYPPFGQAKFIAEWGPSPPDYCRPF